MCYSIIELQEAVKSQASFLELLENRTPITIRNFGAESDEAKEHLKTVSDYRIELIERERKLEKQIASNNGVNLSEPCDLAMLVNNAIDNINELVTDGVIKNNLQAIASHIRDNEYSFNKANSQVSGMLIEHYSNHDFSNNESEEALAEEALAEDIATKANLYWITFSAYNEAGKPLKTVTRLCDSHAEVVKVALALQAKLKYEGLPVDFMSYDIASYHNISYRNAMLTDAKVMTYNQVLEVLNLNPCKYARFNDIGLKGLYEFYSANINKTDNI